MITWVQSLILFAVLWILPLNCLEISTKYDFKTLMGLSNHSINDQVKTFKAKDYAEIELFAKAYKNKIQLLKNASNEIHIPQVIHFIWLGPKDFPNESIKNVQSWRDFHPDWVIKFWTDRADRPLPIPGMVRVLTTEYDFGAMAPFIKLSNNWGEKSDLMRFALLYNEGGIYADHDAECLHSFASFTETYDLVACFDRPHWHEGLKSNFAPANGLLCVAPNHPVLLKTMNEVARVWESVGKKFPGSDYKSVLRRVVQRTFDSFARSVKPFGLDTSTRDLLLPTSFFYPDKTLESKFWKKLQTLGLVYSSHKYARAWNKSDTR